MYLNETEEIFKNNFDERLTLTWDVFKFYYCFNCYIWYFRLTLTWDVFKFF